MQAKNNQAPSNDINLKCSEVLLMIKLLQNTDIYKFLNFSLLSKWNWGSGILFGVSSISGHLYDWTEVFTLSVVYMGVTANSFFYLFLYLGCNFLIRKKTP